jgi:acyl-[acyl-carrier-protein]-phospholipid O-acyltransferase/long-chain-fatty-acid--[acyl-carrier-protein] ligase
MEIASKQAGYYPLMSIMFINSFIDLGHKITLQNAIFKVYDGPLQIALTAIINGLILLPFILFYRSSGLVSDKYPKALIIRWASVSALVISMFILLSYFLGLFWFSYFLTFILAIQSAYVGPAKYGLIKELVNNSSLTSANALAQALVTTGILLGTFVFTLGFETLYQKAHQESLNGLLYNLTPLGIAIVAMSLFECFFAWRIPNTNQSMEPFIEKKHQQGLKPITNDTLLWPVAIGLTVFWSVGQMLLATYPSFAEDVLRIENTIVIQSLMLMLGIGIMAGAFISRFITGNCISLAFVPISGLFIILALTLLPVTTHLPTVFILFFMIGFMGGVFIVPLNTVFQFCTPETELGNNLAGLNLIKNIGMISCLGLTVASAFFDVPANHLLYIILFISLAGIGYLFWRVPYSFSAFKGFKHTLGKKIIVTGFDEVDGAQLNNLRFDNNDSQVKAILQFIYPRKVEDGYLQGGINGQKKPSTQESEMDIDVQILDKSIHIDFKAK